MDFHFTHEGASIKLIVPLAQDGPARLLGALARIVRPADERGLADARADLLESRSFESGTFEFAPGASASWLRGPTLEITTAWGSGPKLLVSAEQPGRAIDVAGKLLAEGLRPVLASSDDAPGSERKVGFLRTRDLAVAGSYVLDRAQNRLVTSDAGALTLNGPGAAELLLVLMRRVGERVTFGELELNARGQAPEQTLLALRRRAAKDGFPLPVVVEPDSAEFVILPTPCSRRGRYLSLQELEGCGLGTVAPELLVSLGGIGVYVTRRDGRCWRSGKVLPPIGNDRRRRLKLEGSDMSSLVITPADDPCGGPGGTQAAIQQVIGYAPGDMTPTP